VQNVINESDARGEDDLDIDSTLNTNTNCVKAFIDKTLDKLHDELVILLLQRQVALFRYLVAAS